MGPALLSGMMTFAALGVRTTPEWMLLFVFRGVVPTAGNVQRKIPAEPVNFVDPCAPRTSPVRDFGHRDGSRSSIAIEDERC